VNSLWPAVILLSHYCRRADNHWVEWRGRIGPTDEVTLNEAAEMLSLAPRLLRHLVDMGELPARTNRFLTYISLADIDIYRLRNRVSVRSAPRPERTQAVPSP
jgi:hypothetical protein